MEILKEGKPPKYPPFKKIKCITCKSELLVDFEDCCASKNPFISPYYYAICPICNNELHYCERYPKRETINKKAEL